MAREDYNVASILFQFIRENQGTVSLYVALMLVFPIGEVLLPHFYGKFIDKASKGGPLWPKVRGDVMAVVCVWVINQVLRTALNRMDAYFVPKLQSYVREHLVLDILAAYKEHYKDLEVGEIVSRLVKMPIVVRDIAYNLRNITIPATLVLVFSIGYFTYLHPKLGLAALVGVGVFMLCVFLFARGCINLSRESDQVDSDLHEEISDMMSNLLTIYSSDTVEEEIKRLEEKQRRLDEAMQKTMRCASDFKVGFNISYTVVFLSINGMAFYLYNTGAISLDSLISSLIIALYMISHFEKVSGDIQDVFFDLGVLQRTQTYLNSLEVRKKTDSFETVLVSRGEIGYSNVSSEPILHNVNLVIPPGQKVAIMGQIGSGKTTFIRLLLKLRPYTGTITIDGQDIAPANPDQLRRQISYVDQRPTLFNRSIYDNIAYGMKDVTEERIRTEVERLGVTGILGDLSRRVGKNGSELSGGQRQVVLLLRCMFRNNPILILDEPTSALDEGIKDQVVRVILEVASGKTVLMVTHDTTLLKYANRTLLFDGGRIVSDAPAS